MTGIGRLPIVTRMTNVLPLLRRKKRPTWSFADRVRKVRRELGMTQAQFAELTGFGEKSIAAWETGKNTPNLVAASVKLEETTEIDRYWWLGWDEDGSPDEGSVRREGLEPPTRWLSRRNTMGTERRRHDPRAHDGDPGRTLRPAAAVRTIFGRKKAA